MAEALGGRAEAGDDMEGVKDADALLFVNVDPDLPYAGSLVEIGMAVAWDKPVYFINTEHMKRNVFYHLPGVYSAADAPYPSRTPRGAVRGDERRCHEVRSSFAGAILEVTLTGLRPYCGAPPNCYHRPAVSGGPTPTRRGTCPPPKHSCS